jgi:23S rRNA (cytidine1920-2'-O)/16S rRNA (cytidine1409-2'-O)-methyltransferase
VGSGASARFPPVCAANSRAVAAERPKNAIAVQELDRRRGIGRLYRQPRVAGCASIYSWRDTRGVTSPRGKQRADLLLVERGLAPSRERARALILAGKVFSGTRRIEKAGESLARGAELGVRGEDHPYVSRGGVKLAGALDAFGLDPRGVVAADFGASTGGFSDCLLQRGAARVYAIDVGRAQLHDRLRHDARVVVMERTNARHLQPGDLPEPLDWIVIDASFIGLAKLLPAARALLRPGGTVVALVKPQFEVGRDRVGKGGVVRDEQARADAIATVASDAAALGFELRGQADSVLPGPAGNRECFVWLHANAGAGLPAPAR